MAATTDLLTKVGLPGSATTLDSPGFTIGNTTINVGNTANWQTETLQCFAMDQVTIEAGKEVRVAGSYRELEGIVTSATSIGSVSFASGFSPRNYPAGSTTRVYIPVSSTRENKIVDWGKKEHKLDGGHKSITTDTIATTGNATIGGTASITGNVSAVDASFSGDVSDKSVLLKTIRNETTFDFVASGCVWSGDAYASTRNGSMTSGVLYIAGKRISLSAITARSFTASKDTYIDIKNDGTVIYTEVTNNAASPSVLSNSDTFTAGIHVRLAIIITGASSIASAGSINQGQWGVVLPIASSTPYERTDSLGNLIFPRDPNRKMIGGGSSGSVSGITGSTMVDTIGGKPTFIIPAGGSNVRITVDIGCNASTNNLAEYGIRVDGSTKKSHRLPMNGTGGWAQSVSIVWTGFLAAGSHTTNACGNVASGAGSITISDVTTVVETI